MKVLAGVMVFCGLLVAGCGGSSSDSSPSSSAVSVNSESGEAATGTEAEDPIEPAGELRGPKIQVEPIEPPYPKELVIRDLRKGTGREAREGDKVTIQFTALYFYGEPFESSWDFGHPFRFELGRGEVSPGWERGLPGMRVGGKRELLVPYQLVSKFGLIPENTPKNGQVYVVELLAVSDA